MTEKKKGRKKKVTTTKAKKKDVKKKLCNRCEKEKQLYEFYNTDSVMFSDGKVPLCKTCIKEMVDVNKVETVKSVLRQIDKPFLDFLWASCLEGKTEPFGHYMRQMNSLPQYKGLSWDDSSESGEVEFKRYISPEEEERLKREQFDESLYVKWGKDFEKEEIMQFEALFNELKENYQLITRSHEEFLKLACISRVKAVNAMASGDSNAVKNYMGIFKDMTQAGKLQPSQFSKADLSDGLDTFGQLAKKVEESVDIIPILPIYKQRPKDLPDVVLWLYINYIRKLKGMPECTYEEIYEFYNERKRSYEDSRLDLDIPIEEEDEGLM